MSKSIYCPYCHRFTYLESKASFGNATGLWEAAECNSCHKVVLMHTNENLIYPNPLPKLIDLRIPEPMKTDFSEAQLCFSVGAYRAAAGMARRALARICLEKGAPADKKLVEKIDWLVQQQIITKDLQDWAHEVRHIGNDALHPENERDVVKEDSSDILELLEQFCQVLYVAPAIARERKQLREQAKP